MTTPSGPRRTMTPDVVERATDPLSGILAGLRMLDLTDERGSLCGRLFADLGADVIKVEPPGGCSSRREPPFLGGIPGPDRSLHFINYSAGKRSITLNLETRAGQELFMELAQEADFVVESYRVGYLESLGLAYQAVAERNPRLIYASITPFGDRGPGREWKASDIVSWAAGGMMFMTGDPGRPPLQASLPQAALHAGAEAGAACMLAHHARERTGSGQRVVIDTQACVTWTLCNEQGMPVLHGDDAYVRRAGLYNEMGGVGVARKRLYRCRGNGYVSYGGLGGGTGLVVNASKAMVAWMGERGMAPDWLTGISWETWTPALFEGSPDEYLAQLRAAEATVEEFFSTMTRAEIYQATLDRRLMLAPVATAADIVNDEQLAAREYFQTVPHEGLGQDLTLGGPFAKFSDSPLRQPGPVPRLGAHNEAVYRDLLGHDAARLRHLYATGVI